MAQKGKLGASNCLACGEFTQKTAIPFLESIAGLESSNGMDLNSGYIFGLILLSFESSRICAVKLSNFCDSGADKSSLIVLGLT